MKKVIVEHLKYRYPQAETLALDDLSFEVDEGEMIGIIGRPRIPCFRMNAFCAPMAVMRARVVPRPRRISEKSMVMEPRYGGRRKQYS